MFRNDLWLADPNQGKLYEIVNGSDGGIISEDLDKNISSVMVSQDMVNVYVTSLSTNKLTQVRGGIKINSIEVGNIPYAMCEDGNGNIWVVNYGDNTVSKIRNMNVVKTIPVPAGPRDIVADSRNNVYVACYLSDKVAHIVNDVVVDEIECKIAPRALTCDIYDNIWVANYSSVSVTKITASKKDLDIPLKDVARAPVDIVTDSNGTIYVANYLGNDVVMIKSTSNSIDIQNIPVPLAPTSLAVDADDTIFVTSETEGTVTPIRDGVAGTPVTIGVTNPIGFRDFTGCATYNVYHDSIASGSKGPWSIANMDNEIQTLLGNLKSGTVNTSADLVSYNSVSFPTVEDALNSLLNVTPICNDFKIVADTFEVGTNVTSLQISWSFNKPMTSAEIRKGSTTLVDLNDGSGSIPQVASNKLITGFTLDTGTTLQLRATDENNVTVQKQANVYFEKKFLYGVLPDTILNTPTPIVGQVQLDTLTKSPVLKLNDVYGLHFKMSCGLNGDKVPCIAVPVDWNIKMEQIAFLNGYSSDWYEIPQVSYDNGTVVIKYKVFVYDLPLAGDIIGTIVKLL
jgi:sugar lactone lactonase YvrE